MLRRRVHTALLALMALALPFHALADGKGDGDSSCGVVRLVKNLGTFIDSMSIQGLDRRYIESPEKPWQIIVTGNVNQSDLKMKATLSGKDMFADDWGDIYWEPHIQTDISTYAGVWLGYRGYGLGYSKNVGGDKGSLLKFGAMGGRYGVNLRIHKFQTDEPEVKISGYMPDWYEGTSDYVLTSPIRVRTLSLDGYYLFNGKKFSYAAAYDQSVIQKRSAGSFMAGAMYYHSSINYHDGLDADFILFMNDIGQMKQSQLSFGAGYAYNLVPCKGLLVSLIAMPMLTVYNRLQVWRYHSNLREKAYAERQNPEPEREDEDDYDIDDYIDDFTVWPVGSSTHHSRMTLNFDARLSVTYNLGNWFINAYGQFSNFRYKFDLNSGRLNDWYINASIGLRL